MSPSSIPTAASFLTVFPPDAPRPLTANLNWVGRAGTDAERGHGSVVGGRPDGVLQPGRHRRPAVDIVGYYELLAPAAQQAQQAAAGPQGATGSPGWRPVIPGRARHRSCGSPPPVATSPPVGGVGVDHRQLRHQAVPDQDRPRHLHRERTGPSSRTTSTSKAPARTSPPSPAPAAPTRTATLDAVLAATGAALNIEVRRPDHRQHGRGNSIPLRSAPSLCRQTCRSTMSPPPQPAGIARTLASSSTGRDLRRP